MTSRTVHTCTLVPAAGRSFYFKTGQKFFSHGEEHDQHIEVHYMHRATRKSGADGYMVVTEDGTSVVGFVQKWNDGEWTFSEVRGMATDGHYASADRACMLAEGPQHPGGVTFLRSGLFSGSKTRLECLNKAGFVLA